MTMEKWEDEKQFETNETDEKSNDEVLEDSEKLEDEEFEGIDQEHILSLEGIAEELQTSNKKLADENQKLQNELEALKERVIRVSAEYENYRSPLIVSLLFNKYRNSLALSISLYSG